MENVKLLNELSKPLRGLFFQGSDLSTITSINPRFKSCYIIDGNYHHMDEDDFYILYNRFYIKTKFDEKFNCFISPVGGFFFDDKDLYKCICEQVPKDEDLEDEDKYIVRENKDAPLVSELKHDDIILIFQTTTMKHLFLKVEEILPTNSPNWFIVITNAKNSFQFVHNTVLKCMDYDQEWYVGKDEIVAAIRFYMNSWYKMFYTKDYDNRVKSFSRLSKEDFIYAVFNMEIEEFPIQSLHKDPASYSIYIKDEITLAPRRINIPNRYLNSPEHTYENVSYYTNPVYMIKKYRGYIETTIDYLSKEMKKAFDIDLEKEWNELKNKDNGKEK